MIDNIHQSIQFLRELQYQVTEKEDNTGVLSVVHNHLEDLSRLETYTSLDSLYCKYGSGVSAEKREAAIGLDQEVQVLCRLARESTVGDLKTKLLKRMDACLKYAGILDKEDVSCPSSPSSTPSDTFFESVYNGDQESVLKMIGNEQTEGKLTPQDYRTAVKLFHEQNNEKLVAALLDKGIELGKIQNKDFKYLIPHSFEARNWSMATVLLTRISGDEDGIEKIVFLRDDYQKLEEGDKPEFTALLTEGQRRALEAYDSASDLESEEFERAVNETLMRSHDFDSGRFPVELDREVIEQLQSEEEEEYQKLHQKVLSLYRPRSSSAPARLLSEEESLESGDETGELVKYSSAPTLLEREEEGEVAIDLEAGDFLEEEVREEPEVRSNSGRSWLKNWVIHTGVALLAVAAQVGLNALGS